jgi:hypothetical protein
MFDYKKLYKFLLEGFAVAISAYFILGRKGYKEIIIIGLTAAAAFAILDRHSTVLASGMRQGSGFGIGWNMVGGDASNKEENKDDDTVSTNTTPSSSPSSSISSSSSSSSSSEDDDDSVIGSNNDTVSEESDESSNDETSSDESSNDSINDENVKSLFTQKLNEGVSKTTDKLMALFK